MIFASKFGNSLNCIRVENATVFKRLPPLICLVPKVRRAAVDVQIMRTIFQILFRPINLKEKNVLHTENDKLTIQMEDKLR